VSQIPPEQEDSGRAEDRVAKVERFGLQELATSLGVETVTLDQGLDLAELARGTMCVNGPASRIHQIDLGRGQPLRH
jgi:hypothetical protein